MKASCISLYLQHWTQACSCMAVIGRRHRLSSKYQQPQNDSEESRCRGREKYRSPCRMTRRAKLKCTTHNGKSIFLLTPHLAPDLDRKWQQNMHPMSPIHFVVLRSEGPYRMNHTLRGVFLLNHSTPTHCGTPLPITRTCRTKKDSSAERRVTTWSKEISDTGRESFQYQ